MKTSINLKVMSHALALLVIMSMLTACSNAESARYVTGKDYLKLKKGEAYQATRPLEVWASEYVIQMKDEQIMDLVRANDRLVREINMLRSTH